MLPAISPSAAGIAGTERVASASIAGRIASRAVSR
jgi:hypothetical protein